MKPELLAPAGSMEALVAAVRCGADAVYMGLGNFNARKNANNFDLSSFAQAVEYCHVRGKKVYLTLNTLVADHEMQDALGCAKSACEAGADAVIVQDIGLASLLREACPSLKLHASTQMSVQSPAAMPFLKSAGFSRVVIAREMSANEIGDFTRAAAQSGIETEVFVHGALCMSVSGQCYMSGMLGRRSGNRGLCAQPCRLPFSSGQCDHALSLKDMSLLDNVGELCQMGVRSFKIEGRMKRPEYVAAAVTAFRTAIDGGDTSDIKSALSGIFSRSGHTSGYFCSSLGKNMFGFRTQSDVRSSGENISSLHELYRSERACVPVNIEFYADIGKPSVLIISDGEHRAEVCGPAAEQAVSRPMTAEYAAQKLSKLGSTPFFAKSTRCVIGENAVVRVSSLGEMRREAADKLCEMRKPLPKPFSMPALTVPAFDKTAGRQKICVRVPDISLSFPLDGIDEIYLPAETDFKANADKIESINKQGVKIGIELPRASFSLDEKYVRWIENAKSAGINAVMCHNLSALCVAADAKMEICAGFGMNVFNSFSAQKLLGCGVDQITLSFEETLDRLKDIPGKCGVIVYGRLPLMITRNCPASLAGGCDKCGKRRVLTDRTGTEFPVICRQGTSEVLNSVPVVMSDRKGDVSGFSFALFYFTNESPSECRRAIDSFIKGNAPSPPFTRGLYYRGVL